MSKTFTVGIAGGSASGKSTLTQVIENRLSDLKIKVIHMDDYFKDVSQRPVSMGHINNKEYLDDNHPLTMNLPKFARDLENMQQENYDAILAEGLLTLNDTAICSLLDLKIFVDCRNDERIVRRLKRNMERGLTFDQISDIYLNLVRYRHDEYVEFSKWRADLIFNGSNPSDTAYDMLEMAIRKKIKQA